MGLEAAHARRSNYAARVFRPAADGIYPAEERRRGYHTDPWRVHCSLEPFPGVPVPTGGRHRAKAEQLAECCLSLAWRRTGCGRATRRRCGATGFLACCGATASATAPPATSPTATPTSTTR